MKDEICIDGVVYVKKSCATMLGESMYVEAVSPMYGENYSYLRLELAQSQDYRMLPITKFKPGMTIRATICEEINHAT